MEQNDPRVSAVLLDENTLSVDGVQFVRKSDTETLLKQENRAIAPKLKCVKCNFGRPYTYFFQKLGFEDMIVNHCPGCGRKIMGVLPWSGDEEGENPWRIV